MIKLYRGTGLLCCLYKNNKVSVRIFNKHRELLAESAAAPVRAEQELTEITYAVKESFWQSRVQEITGGGIHVASHRVQVSETIHLESTAPHPMPGLLFVKSGTITARINDTACLFAPRQHNLLYNAYATDHTTFDKQDNLELFILSFQPDRFLQVAEGHGPLLDTLADAMAGTKTFRLAAQRNMPIMPAMYEIMHAILHCPFTGATKKLYLEAKSLELLALQCGQLEEGIVPKTKLKLSPADIRKLQEVKDRLVDDPAHTPTLAVLAKATGLNEFKLKAGFKELFGTTVFGFLGGHRLQLAKTAIEKTDRSLTDIALETGFSSIYHFSYAFKKKFGTSPSRYRS